MAGGSNSILLVPFTNVFENAVMVSHSTGIVPRFVAYRGVMVPVGV